LKQALKQPSKVQQPDGKDQAQLYEQAMSLFLRRDFAAAKPLFERAAQGAAVELAHSASMHVRMCERRMGGGAPKSAQEQFHYGVALMNQGNYEGAEPALRRAVEAEKSSGQYLYALALCLANQGRIDDSLDQLKRAVEADPAYRDRARSDADFHALGETPIRDWLRGEGS
jgi:tetratricopeptide (TPR) repeat protein